MYLLVVYIDQGLFDYFYTTLISWLSHKSRIINDPNEYKVNLFNARNNDTSADFFFKQK